MSAGFHFHFDSGLSDERSHTWTSFGSPNVQSSAAKFGAAGVTLNGSSGIYIEPTAGGDFLLSGQFTIEGWFKVNSGTAGHLMAWVGATNASKLAVYYTSSGGLRLYNGNDGDVITGASIPRGTYFHAAWTRDASSVMRLFVDGVLVGSHTNSASIDPSIVILFSYSAAIPTASTSLTGDADELICDPGVCRYAANFTPPTAPFAGPVSGTLTGDSPLGDAAFLASQYALSLAADGPLGDAAFTAAQYAISLEADGPLGDASFSLGQFALSLTADSPLGDAEFVAAQYALSLSADGPLGDASFQGAQFFAALSADSPLGDAAFLGSQYAFSITADSPLGNASLLAFQDFTGSVVGPTTYVMDLITTSGLVRVPISSWQATLQTDAACYVQCVVPAAAPWVATILAATAFVISRRARLADGSIIEYEMARSPLEVREPSQGPGSYTVVLSGYPDALTANDDPPTAQDRTLQGVRSAAGLPGGMRVRADIDWLLRPGMRALYGSTPILVDYINYYVPGNDQYMDVGERA